MALKCLTRTALSNFACILHFISFRVLSFCFVCVIVRSSPLLCGLVHVACECGCLVLRFVSCYFFSWRNFLDFSYSNYVNEKLQQIFIQFTLKNEQEVRLSFFCLAKCKKNVTCRVTGRICLWCWLVSRSLPLPLQWTLQLSLQLNRIAVATNNHLLCVLFRSCCSFWLFLRYVFVVCRSTWEKELSGLLLSILIIRSCVIWLKRRYEVKEKREETDRGRGGEREKRSYFFWSTKSQRWKQGVLLCGNSTCSSSFSPS